ncbi:MAG: FMN-binding protein [Oscillospiraceae bacterium]|nr:FMN-binding protein [Oscillospiraceae bacterium]
MSILENRVVKRIIDSLKWIARSSMLRSILVLSLVAAICSLALAYTNITTRGSVREVVRVALEDAAEHLGNYAEIIEVHPKGYGGDIHMVIGVSENGEVTGVVIIGMNETPGLGSKIEDEDFLNQFIGKRAGVSVGKGSNNVDAIAGATVSSKAVAEGVAHALEIFAELSAGGGE